MECELKCISAAAAGTKFKEPWGQMLGKKAACIQGERRNRRKRPSTLSEVCTSQLVTCLRDRDDVTQFNVGKAKTPQQKGGEERWVKRTDLSAGILHHATAFQGASVVVTQHRAACPMDCSGVGGVGTLSSRSQRRGARWSLASRSAGRAGG